MLNSFKAYYKITRPLNIAITFITVIVAAFICTEKPLDWTELLLASLAAAFTAAAGNIINDILDIEIDKLVHSDRPLPRGLIYKKEAIFFYIILIVFSVLTSWLVKPALFMIVIVTNVLLLFYSLYLKKLPLTGNFIVSLLTGLTFIYGGIAVENVSAAFIPFVFAFLINLIRELVKDIQDLSGDVKNNLRTYPIVYGVKKSKILMMILYLILIAATFYPFITKIYKIEYFLIVMTIVNPLLVYCLKLLFEEQPENPGRISSLLKLNMIFGLAAIYFGK
jgi:geranylgeranylglycerol-phosphate geranylgeranyltransferase